MSSKLPRAPAFPFAREAPFDPPALYRPIREREPIFPVTLWNGRRAWLLTRHADIRRVMRDPRFSSEFAHPDFPAVTAARAAVDKQERAFIAMENPAHDHFRQMFQAEFSIRRMQALVPRIDAIAARLIDEMLAAGPPCDLVEMLAQKFPALVMCELFGSPFEDHRFIMQCAAARHGLAQSQTQAVASAQALVDYCANLIAAKEITPGDDMLSRLVEQYVTPGTLERADLANIGAMLLRAGHDTTANMIALGTLLLLEHPTELLKLRADGSLLNNAVEEMLRFLSIVQFVPRRVALEDVELDGVGIEAGDGVFGLTPAANRDEAVFANPDEFDITRVPNDHLAFGFGLHHCLGHVLARFELRSLFGVLFQRIPSLRCAVSLAEITFKADSQIYGVYRLPVTWDKQ